MALTAPPPDWAKIKNKPNTVAGYGMTDFAANAAAPGAVCTYTGSLVESAGMNFGYVDGVGSFGPSASGSVDLGANRIAQGMRMAFAGIPGYIYLYLRGYNIKNN